jgi:hypothetical protein
MNLKLSWQKSMRVVFTTVQSGRFWTTKKKKVRTVPFATKRQTTSSSPVVAHSTTEWSRFCGEHGKTEFVFRVPVAMCGEAPSDKTKASIRPAISCVVTTKPSLTWGGTAISIRSEIPMRPLRQHRRFRSGESTRSLSHGYSRLDAHTVIRRSAWR